MAQGLNPVERGAAKVQSAKAALERITNDTANAPKPSKQLAQADLRQMGQVLTAHVAIVDDAAFETALADPAFFGKVVSRLHAMDRLLIIDRSKTREADCVVIGVDHMNALVQVFQRQRFDYPTAIYSEFEADKIFEIKDAGLGHGFEIVRRADNVVLQRGIESFDKAQHHRRILHANRMPA